MIEGRRLLIDILNAALVAVDPYNAVRRAEARLYGIHPETSLGNNDSYQFSLKVDAATHSNHHVIIGLTGTNVMDLQIMLIERRHNPEKGS
jgi:glycerate-2-kinase